MFDIQEKKIAVKAGSQTKDVDKDRTSLESTMSQAHINVVRTMTRCHVGVRLGVSRRTLRKLRPGTD